MGLWGFIFATCYDGFMAGSEGAGLAEHRRRLLSQAAGRVLEIGAGTGANLPYYGNAVEEVVVTEPEKPMARRLRRRLTQARIKHRLVLAGAERLPFDPESFDFVVATLVLCTVARPAAALAEVHRVLKPDGRLLFIEHVRSSDPGLALWQDRLRRPWAWFGNGCQCDRATPAAIRGAGFVLAEMQETMLPRAPPIVRPLVVGVALRRSQKP